MGRQALRAGRGYVHVRANQGAKVAFQLLLDPPKFILQKRKKAGGESPLTVRRGTCPHLLMVCTELLTPRHRELRSSERADTSPLQNFLRWD